MKWRPLIVAFVVLIVLLLSYFVLLFLNTPLAVLILPPLNTSESRDISRVVNLVQIATSIQLSCLENKTFPQSRGSTGAERIVNLFSNIASTTYENYDDRSKGDSGFPERYDFVSKKSASGILSVKLETKDWSLSGTRLKEYIDSNASRCSGSKYCINDNYPPLSQCTGSEYCISVSCAI